MSLVRHRILDRNNIGMWTIWNNPSRINHSQTHKIMTLDMFEIGSFSECRDIPIQIPYPTMDLRIPKSNHRLICFEERKIDRIEADNRHIESDICFCN
jgi:hypothetical protein